MRHCALSLYYADTAVMTCSESPSILDRRIFLDVKEYCALVLSAESGEGVQDGERGLKKIVHMPLDPDILLWVFKAKHNFTKRSYSAVNGRYDFDQVHSFTMDQAKRQIFYFSQMLAKGIYSKEELKHKVRPYITAQTGKRVLARVMVSSGASVMLTEGSLKCSRPVKAE